MNQEPHKIKRVLPGTIAEEMGLEPGDGIIRINGEEIKDIFDYQYLMQDTYIEVSVLTKDGEESLLEIDKELDEDLGVEFENGLMDEYCSCQNKCIFCFIDQMPKGMRETLYFKDDDSRLSFLQGNYVTLTNMSDSDIERIIKYHLEPINISFQTTNPQLRCKMLNNRFAGEALKKAEMLYRAGIEMNGQIVLCRGINDGEELERSISDLSEYIPVLRSVSVVPVGISRYRDGLEQLEPFSSEDAGVVIDQIEKWQEKIFRKHQIHFIHASDEWYLLAGRPLPEEERYDGYLQLENGVGMVRLLTEEFHEALYLGAGQGRQAVQKRRAVPQDTVIATGKLAFSTIQGLMNELQEVYPERAVRVIPVRNDFFGPEITVSGLLTGQDIAKQLAGKLKPGSRLLLPENVLRSGEQVFLDDYTVQELEKTLQVTVIIVKSSGSCLLDAVMGDKTEQVM